MPDFRQNPSSSQRLFTRQIGNSMENRPILIHQTALFKAAAGGTLLVGGIHGDERASVLLLLSFLDRLVRENRADLASIPLGVIPIANPDGYFLNSRYNARGVDINRNFETGWNPQSEEPPGEAPWSEPESCVLRDFIDYQRPARIVTLHWALGELDADGEQSVALAQTMWDALSSTEKRPYRLRDNPSPCPGSLGQWCGIGMRYPDGTAPAIVTLELPFDPLRLRPEPLPEDHLAHLLRRWQGDAHSYLAATERGVHKMLAAACRNGY